MKFRIMGTLEECSAFIEMIKKTVPKENIRNISDFYPNTRKCTYSNEGRVYIELDKPQFDQTKLKAGRP